MIDLSMFDLSVDSCISFSGGRTSAYMLWLYIQANNGIPDGSVVCFANTGKEDEATLRFVRDCAINFCVDIVWLEYTKDEPGYKIVDFSTAARDGEPYAEMIGVKNYLPNPAARFCTIELKIRPMAKYLVDIGMAETKSEAENMSVVGIRADEQRRAAKISDKSRIPLFYAGITKADVGSFWQSMSFDLELPNIGGVTYHGNCDLCFLKGRNQIESLIAENPSRADWWIMIENTTLASKPMGGRFRNDRPDYAAMKQYVSDQMVLFGGDDDESIACFCGE